MCKNELKKVLKTITSCKNFEKFQQECKKQGYEIVFKSNNSPIQKIDTHFHNKKLCVLFNDYNNTVSIEWNRLNKVLTFKKI